MTIFQAFGKNVNVLTNVIPNELFDGRVVKQEGPSFNAELAVYAAAYCSLQHPQIDSLESLHKRSIKRLSAAATKYKTCQRHLSSGLYFKNYTTL